MAQIEQNIIDNIKPFSQYLSATTALALDEVGNNLTGYSSEELSPGLREQVIKYLTNASKKAKKAANDLTKYSPDSKEYKKTIDIQNQARRGVETLKNDLGYWANFKVANYNGIQNHSRLADPYKKDLASRLVIDEASVDSTAVISDNGLAFNVNGQIIHVSEFSLPETTNTADIAATPIRDLIEQQATERSFNRTNVEGEVREIVDGLQKQGGWIALKSLAGDYKFDNGTEHKTFIDSIAELEGGLTTQFKENLEISIADNPETSIDDLEKLNKDAYEVALSYIWNNENNDPMKEKMVNYLVDVVEGGFNSALGAPMGAAPVGRGLIDIPLGGVVLPEVTIEETKDPRSSADPALNLELNKYFRSVSELEFGEDVKAEDITKITPSKIKNMPENLFEYYVKRIKDISKSKDPKHVNFIKSLPGGSYYKLLRTMNTWRKGSLSPAELIKKYSA